MVPKVCSCFSTTIDQISFFSFQQLKFNIKNFVTSYNEWNKHFVGLIMYDHFELFFHKLCQSTPEDPCSMLKIQKNKNGEIDLNDLCGLFDHDNNETRYHQLLQRILLIFAIVMRANFIKNLGVSILMHDGNGFNSKKCELLHHCVDSFLSHLKPEQYPYLYVFLCLHIDEFEYVCKCSWIIITTVCYKLLWSESRY